MASEAYRMFEEYANKASVVDKDARTPQKKRKADDGRIDLHGLTLENAIAKVENRLARGGAPVVFVTGEGRGSITSYSVLKTGVGDYLSGNASRFGISVQAAQGGWKVCFGK